MKVQYDFVTGTGSPLYEAAVSISDVEFTGRGKLYSHARESLLLRLEEHARQVARAIEAVRVSEAPATPDDDG